MFDLYYDPIPTDRCWAKDICRNYMTKNCNNYCVRFKELNFLMQHSELPISKQYKLPLIPEEVDVESFNRLVIIKENIINFVETGQNLYIYGTKTGNGKTSWAIKLLQEFIHRSWEGNCYTEIALFIHVPSFLLNSKLSIKTIIPEYDRIIPQIGEIDLVVWDDISVSNLTNYEFELLLSFIDKRTFAGKSNIFTSNITPQKLPITLGERIASRINDSIQIELHGSDRRGKVDWFADIEQNNSNK